MIRKMGDGDILFNELLGYFVGSEVIDLHGENDMVEFQYEKCGAGRDKLNICSTYDATRIECYECDYVEIIWRDEDESEMGG